MKYFDLMLRNKKFSAVFPVRNEFDSLLISIPFLVANSNLVGEILIVADHESDTSFKAQPTLANLSVPVIFMLNPNPGILGAIETAVKSANYEYILLAAADEIYPILQMDEIALKLFNEVDFVSATRYAAGGQRYGGNPLARSFSLLGNYWLRFRYKGKLTDFTTGFKGFKKVHWGLLSEQADGPGWSCILTFSQNAIRERLRLCEIPIVSVDRKLGGTSTLKLSSWLKGYLVKIK